MNTKPYPHLLRFAALIVLFASGSGAQQPAKTEAPSGDPFTRDGKQARSEPAGEPPLATVISGLLEYIEVSREDWLAYSMAHPTGSDATELRGQVQQWIKAGKAKTVELTCTPTLNGNRSAVESNIERRYGIGFAIATPDAIPTSFETRNAHLNFEWEPVVEKDGASINNSLACGMTFYGGETAPFDPNRKAPRSTTPQPRFNTVKCSLLLKAAPNQPFLLQVGTPFDPEGNARDDVRHLTFFRTAVTKVKRDGSGGEAGRPFAFELERVAVNLADLSAWFADKPVETASADLRAAAREWVRAGRASDLDRVGGPITSGSRSVWENIKEHRYPVEYAIEQQSANVVPMPKVAPQSFGDHVLAEQLRVAQSSRPILQNPMVYGATYETRNVGYTLEMEPVLEGGTVNVQIAARDVRYCGETVLHRRQSEGRWETTIEQPLFAHMSSSTILSVPLGQYALLGIHTPPAENATIHPTQRIVTFIAFRK